MLSKGINIFFGGERIKPVSHFPEDIKCINLTKIEEYGMISHDLCNLVLDISEEEYDRTVVLNQI